MDFTTYSTIAFFVSALSIVAIACGFNAARREFAKQQRQHRMAQALRRGLLQAEGTPVRSRARVLPVLSY